MKAILLWDPRFPDNKPVRLTVDDTLASAMVRSGVAAAADLAQAGVLNSGAALDPGMLTEVILQHGVNRTAMTRVFLPYSVVLVGASLGLMASIGTPISGMVAPKPTLSLSSAIPHAEGNSCTASMVWTLTLNRNGSTTAFPFNWAVTGSGGSPADANDFGGTFPSGSGTFAAGETSKWIAVLVTGDTAVEPDETFLLTVTAAGLNTVTSTGDDLER